MDPPGSDGVFFCKTVLVDLSLFSISSSFTTTLYHGLGREGGRVRRGVFEFLSLASVKLRYNIYFYYY